MRKEPSRRYVSVAALAGDVQNYLTGYPVEARSATWKYRSGKFVRRHKAAVLAAAAVAIALVIFSIGMGLLAKRATRERLAAQRESQFLEGIFQAATPNQSRGQQITARELLDGGAKRVDRELAGDPVLQGTMLDNIGRAYVELGLYSQGEALLRRAYDLRKKTLGGVERGRREHRRLVGQLYPAARSVPESGAFIPAVTCYSRKNIRESKQRSSCPKPGLPGGGAFTSRIGTRKRSPCCAGRWRWTARSAHRFAAQEITSRFFSNEKGAIPRRYNCCVRPSRKSEKGIRG